LTSSDAAATEPQPLDTKLLDVNTVSPPHDSGGMTALLAGTLMWTFLAGLSGKKV
jgi:agmatinase